MPDLDGTYEGVVKGAKWSEWEADGGIALPLLNIPVEVTVGSEVVRGTPALFFDNQIIDRGNDAGKTRLEVSLQVLASMGVEVDAEDFGNNDPTAWPDALEGKQASVYTTMGEDRDGKPRRKWYLNRRGRPAISDERVQALWGDIITGSKASDNRDPAPAADTGSLFPEAGATDDDNIPF